MKEGAQLSNDLEVKMYFKVRGTTDVPRVTTELLIKPGGARKYIAVTLKCLILND